MWIYFTCNIFNASECIDFTVVLEVHQILRVFVPSKKFQER